MSKSLGDIKWGDVDYDDEGSTFHPSSSLHSSLPSGPTAQGSLMPAIPATIVSKVDASGLRTITEYGTNEKGMKVRITKKMRPVRRQVLVNRRVLERQQWAKFGDCAGLQAGPEPNVTYTSIEVINLDLRPKKREEEKEESGLDKLSGSTSIVVCRNCGETGHWTLKCPKRSQIKPYGDHGTMDDEKAGDGGAGGAGGKDGGAGGKYVPMHMRGGAAGASRPGDNGTGRGLSQLDDSCSLRVTNLSEECTEADLSLLFRRFGHTSRIYLAKDRVTGVSRGFAFVSYTNRHDAQAAINKLNGHGYDNLILHVEWAKPREVKPEAEQESIGGGGK